MKEPLWKMYELNAMPLSLPQRQIESHRVTINERRSEEHLQITTLNTQVLELKQQCEETEVLKQLIESYKVQIERLQGGGGRWKIEKNKLLVLCLCLGAKCLVA